MLGELKSFEDFSRAMRESPYLKGVEKKNLDRLLRELYELTRDRERMKEIAFEARQSVTGYREFRKLLSRAAGLLRHALKDVRQARQTFAGRMGDLQMVEDHMLDERGGIPLLEIERHLQTSIDFLALYELYAATHVDPRLRNPAEKRLVQEPPLAFPNEMAEDIVHSVYPPIDFSLGEKLQALDRQLIIDAEACLDRYRDSKNRKIRGKYSIMSKLTENAPMTPMNEESIRLILRRHRKKQKVKQ